MTIEQITDIAWAAVSELEPAQSFDVFDVTDSQIIFQSEHGLKRVCLPCLDNGSLKEQIKKELYAWDKPRKLDRQFASKNSSVMAGLRWLS